MNQDAPLSHFFTRFNFTPVIDFPADYEVFDFTKGYDPQRNLRFDYGVGKYDEKRPGMYQGELYADHRDIHVGIDLAAPVGSEIRAFFPGSILSFANNSAPFDYGYTLVTEHQLEERKLYVLWGHLSQKSLEGKRPGQKFGQGDVLAWIGNKNENGGWNPHLHFQLSWLRPEKADLPGVVSEKDRQQALLDYPDPRLVLGPIY